MTIFFYFTFFRRSNSREQNRFRWRGICTRHVCRRRPSLAVRTRRWPADRCRQQQHRVGTRTRAALERPLRLVFSRALPRRPPSAGRALDSSLLNTHTIIFQSQSCSHYLPAPDRSGQGKSKVARRPSPDLADLSY